MKKFFALFLTMALLFSYTTLSYASEDFSANSSKANQEDEIQPRIGHAGYGSTYHNGNSIAGSFTFPVKSILLPMNRWTVKTSGFPSNAEITASLYYNGQLLSQHSARVTGNGESKGPLVPGAVFDGTYTVKYDVWGNSLNTSATGTIEVWVY